jgi:hypothetical protein
MGDPRIEDPLKKIKSSRKDLGVTPPSNSRQSSSRHKSKDRRKRTSRSSFIMVKTVLFLLALSSSLFQVAVGGPLAYGICQSGCNALAVACYAGAGFAFGTVTAGAGTPAAIVACNAALGTCMAACIAAGFLPTP